MTTTTTTRSYLAACVAVTALVQTQRIAPATIAFPASPREALLEPWRLLSAFCYEDGLTLGFALRLHVVACLSYSVEWVCASRPLKRCRSFRGLKCLLPLASGCSAGSHAVVNASSLKTS